MVYKTRYGFIYPSRKFSELTTAEKIRVVNNIQRLATLSLIGHPRRLRTLVNVESYICDMPVITRHDLSLV